MRKNIILRRILAMTAAMTLFASGSAYAENDATVAYGSKDFVFTNSYDYPIEIVAHSYKAVVEIKLLKIE